MKTFTTVVAFIFSLLTALVAAAPIARDVWDPLILTPTTGFVWQAGNTYDVTWDTSSAPAQVTNPNGIVVLSKAGVLDFGNPLASGFSLYDGCVEVTIPSGTVTGSDYAIVLFGDSGNASPYFTISGS